MRIQRQDLFKLDTIYITLVLKTSSGLVSRSGRLAQSELGDTLVKLLPVDDNTQFTPSTLCTTFPVHVEIENIFEVYELHQTGNTNATKTT